MPTTDAALATVDHVEQLADQLSDCADELHVRIVREIKAHGNAPMSDAEQAAARALLDDEAVLRQRANALYADAARAVVSTLGASQAQLIALTQAAAAQIRNITLLGDAAGLVAGLLMLAGTAATGKPAPILLALEKITHQVQDLRTDLKKR
jgi:hypothetical protein